MKILHVVSYLYPHIGGIEQTARDIFNALSESGSHEQRAICFNGEKETVHDEVDGVPVVRCGNFATISSQSLSFSYKKELKKLMREFMPDCVVFHYPNPFLATYLLREMKRYPACKLVLWWHLDIIKQRLLGKFFNGQTRRLLARAACVTATSPNYIEGSKFLSECKEKCVVIPSCIREDRLRFTQQNASASEALRAQYAGKVICFAFGRHVAYKGLEYLVDAAKLLDDRFVVLIGGEGELTASLEARAAGDSKIRFLGRLSDDELKAALSACDIFCFPSVTKNEAFGLALAEAMHYGKPSVTFTIPGSGVNFVSVKDETGLEVANRDSEAFAAAIRALAEDASLRKRLGDAAQMRAKQLFTFEKFSEQVRELISSLEPKE